jgi:hypothetical protein
MPESDLLPDIPDELACQRLTVALSGPLSATDTRIMRALREDDAKKCRNMLEALARENQLHISEILSNPPKRSGFGTEPRWKESDPGTK